MHGEGELVPLDERSLVSMLGPTSSEVGLCVRKDSHKLQEVEGIGKDEGDPGSVVSDAAGGKRHQRCTFVTTEMHGLVDESQHHRYVLSRDPSCIAGPAENDTVWWNKLRVRGQSFPRLTWIAYRCFFQAHPQQGGRVYWGAPSCRLGQPEGLA